jgi:hypothetical protein
MEFTEFAVRCLPAHVAGIRLPGRTLHRLDACEFVGMVGLGTEKKWRLFCMVTKLHKLGYNMI